MIVFFSILHRIRFQFQKNIKSGSFITKFNEIPGNFSLVFVPLTAKYSYPMNPKTMRMLSAGLGYELINVIPEKDRTGKGVRQTRIRELSDTGHMCYTVIIHPVPGVPDSGIIHPVSGISGTVFINPLSGVSNPILIFLKSVIKAGAL